MDKQTPDFWAMEDRHLLEHWPKTPDGQPQPAAKLAIQWELDSMADITLSLLESCVFPRSRAGVSVRYWGVLLPRGSRSGSPPTGWKRPRLCWTPLPSRRNRSDPVSGIPSVLSSRY